MFSGFLSIQPILMSAICQECLEDIFSNLAHLVGGQHFILNLLLMFLTLVKPADLLVFFSVIHILQKIF